MKGLKCTLNQGWRRHSLVSGLLKMRRHGWFINTNQVYLYMSLSHCSDPKSHGSVFVRGFCKARLSNTESWVWHSHFISHQQFDNKSLGFRAEVRKHALFKSHIIVPDVKDRASVILSRKGRHTSEAVVEKEWIVSPRVHNELWSIVLKFNIKKIVCYIKCLT